MSNTNSAKDLGQRIEQLIQEHVAASRAFAQEAVARGFAMASRPQPPSGPVRQPRSSPGKKRPSADIAALGERFYKAVCAKPGETMTVLAPGVGASARELQRSVTLLRRANRVRSVGSRHLTRYFPMASA
jgi:hypothetical protein